MSEFSSDNSKPARAVLSAADPARAGTAASGRVLEIDALRGLAAVAVMLFHYTTWYQIHHTGPVLASFPYGRQCVWLFFAISGFVILMTAERCRSVADFAVARFARLYPAYWVAVIVSFFLITYFGDLTLGRPESRLYALLNLTMIQEAFSVPDLDGTFWSLYVELTFYVLVGLLIASGRLKALPWILVGLSAARTLSLSTGLEDQSPLADGILHYFPVMRFVEYFTLGVWTYRSTIQRTWMFLPVYLVLLGCAAAKGQFPPFLLISLLFLGAAHGRMRWLAHPVLLFLGTISYSLYLLHENLGLVVMGWLEHRGVEPNLAVLAAIACAMTVASLNCFLVERPVNDFIRSWWKTRRSSVLQVSPEPAAG